MFWFDKADKRAVFGDRRVESHVLCDGRALNITPDVQLDVRALPFADESFYHVVYDPPHFNNLGASSWMAKKYGRLEDGWEEDLAKGFRECFRVLKPNGTLIFKWNETQITVSRILALIDQKPLYGHKSGKQQKTHWMAFIKGPST